MTTIVHSVEKLLLNKPDYGSWYHISDIDYLTYGVVDKDVNIRRAQRSLLSANACAYVLQGRGAPQPPQAVLIQLPPLLRQETVQRRNIPPRWCDHQRMRETKRPEPETLLLPVVLQQLRAALPAVGPQAEPHTLRQALLQTQENRLGTHGQGRGEHDHRHLGLRQPLRRNRSVHPDRPPQHSLRRGHAPNPPQIRQGLGGHERSLLVIAGSYSPTTKASRKPYRTRSATISSGSSRRKC